MFFGCRCGSEKSTFQFRRWMPLLGRNKRGKIELESKTPSLKGSDGPHTFHRPTDEWKNNRLFLFSSCTSIFSRETSAHKTKRTWVHMWTHTNIHVNTPSCPHFHALSALRSVTAKMDDYSRAELLGKALNSLKLQNMYREIR